MRAFFNLIFFLFVLAAGGLVGYLYGLTGKQVPVVSEQLAKVVSLPNAGDNSEKLAAAMAANERQLQALQQNSLEKDDAISRLQAALREAQRTAAASASTANSAAANDPAFSQSLIENNQFLTDELTLLSVKNAELTAQLEATQTAAQNAVAQAASSASSGVDPAQLEAIQTQLQTVVNERSQLVNQLTAAQERIAQLVSSGEVPSGDNAQLQELQTQVQKLAGERQQLISQLTQVAGQRDQVIAQLNAIGGQLQAQGVDVNALLTAARQALQAQQQGGQAAAPAAATEEASSN